MIAQARPDADAKLRGAATFGVDLDVPGMLWGALVLSDVPHGRIRSIDLGSARRLPGVVAIGPDDVPSLTGGAGGDAERPPFPREEVVYAGQILAAVAAPSLARAREAAARVRVEIDPLPHLTDLDAVFPEWPEADAAKGPHVISHVLARRGDAAAALRGAERVVRETYRTSGVSQVALEPHACVAEVSGDRWSVRTTTQSPFGVREDVASILGLPEKDVVVEGTYVGGGFGGKASSLVETPALLLAKASGRPVRLALSYREEFLLGRSTLPIVVRLETGVSNGRPVARRVRLLMDAGASLPGRDFALGYAITFLLGPYRCETFELEGYAVRTHKPPFGAHRAPVVPQAAFVAESHLEEVARAVGADPLEFRAGLLWKDGDSTPLGQRVGPFGLETALRAAGARAAAWRSEGRPGRGVGIGVGYWSTNVGAGGEAEVVLSPTELTIVQGEREIGSGSVLVGLAAVAARRTGLPRSRIRVDYRDTGKAPFDSGVFGSRTVGALGTAVLEALEAMYVELGRRSAGRGDRPSDGSPAVSLGVDGEELVVRTAHDEHRVRELLRPAELATGGLACGGKHYAASPPFDAALAVDGNLYGLQDFVGAAHVAEVSVDPDTGAVRLERYAAFHDVGRVLDEPSARAQVEGGVVMGLGTALTEETIWTDGGRLLNPGLLDYRIPTLGEVPPIDVEFVEGFLGAGPFGAKGLGEPPIIPVPAAVAAAVRDATGVHLTELPLSAERVARALKRQRSSHPPYAPRPG